MCEFRKMTSNRLIKALVIIFSLTGGALLTWQLSRNLSGESSSQVGEDDQKATSAMPIGPKSVGGSLNFAPASEGDIERPLLPGSKVGVTLLINEAEILDSPFDSESKEKPSKK